MSNIFVPDAPDGETRHISYAALLADVVRMANTLKTLGVQKGDRVTLYMPMIPEGAVAMLACARIGAVHSVIFGGFSPDAIAGRARSEAHTSELQSLMCTSYAVFCLK